MSTRIRVLYAEDSALDADLTRAHFDQAAADFELTIANTGAACLEQLTQHRFEVLLLDNHLPDMDGIDVLTQLRRSGQRLPVVMVTGVGDDETVASALRAGASDYVPKSGEYLSTLPPLLRMLVARHQTEHMLESDDSRREQHILYIEPNAMDAELTQQHFVTHAPRLRLHLLGSCVEALGVLSQPHGFDLVLTDLRVPGMDALEFLHEARRLQLDVPFVIITGKGDEATAVALLRLGAVDYLVKRDNYLVQLPHLIEHALHRFRLDQTTRKLHGELQELNASLETKVIQRTAELHETQDRLRATFDAIPDLIWQKDRNGRYVACNPALEQLLARPRAAVLGCVDADLFDAATASALSEQHEWVVANAGPLVREQTLQHLGCGEHVLFEVVSTPMQGPDGFVQGVLAVARDITESKASQEKIRSLSQIYATLSQCNQAIVHCATEAELFNQICLQAVRFGGMKMAWIGLVDTTRQAMTVAASFGEGAQSLLHGIEISVDAAQPGGCGPTSLAIRQGQAVWCQDFLHDPMTAAWHQVGAQHGWGASAALPLFRGGDAVVGAFNLYAGEAHAFDETTRSLLLEMAADISFALANFERDAARTRAEDALRLTRISVEAASEALFWITPNGRIVDVNVAACRALGYERDELVTLFVHDVDAEFEPSRWVAHFEELRAHGSLTLESTHRTKDGRQFPVEIVANYVKFGDEERNCVFVRDMTAHKASEARIQQLAYFDALTGLPNRLLFNDRISHALSMAQRNQIPLALLLLDLDHFKNVNDNLSHRVGDNLLIELAQRLSQTIREEDTASRLGGDEFLLLLPGADSSAAARVAEKLMDILSQPCVLDAHELVVTSSIGIAMYPADGEDFEALSKCADVAMYRAKQDGRNGFRFFTPEMQARSARALQLENALRQALKREQLTLHYQAQMSLSNQCIIGVEALLRWQHPELGMVSPAEFIPIAESSGQIIAIGEWVLRQALGQLKLWLADGLPPITMAVNMSAVQFRHPSLPELVSQILAEAGVPADLLELELTEGVTMDDAPSAIAVIDDLHARGVTMSIDDFGTGYSSLGHLKRFKINKLKIDQTFVRDIVVDPDDRAIVVAIINLAKSLGMMTIAEGVETPEQLDFLREHGCDEIQGYLLSRPLPAAQALALIKAHGVG